MSKPPQAAPQMPHAEIALRFALELHKHNHPINSPLNTLTISATEVAETAKIFLRFLETGK